MPWAKLWSFLYARAQIKRDLFKYEATYQDIERAWTLRPGVSHVLMERSFLEAKVGKWEEAGADLLTALRMDSTSHTVDFMVGLVVPKLCRDAVNLQKTDPAKARRLFDLAAAIRPDHDAVQRAKASLSPAARTP
ncbi:MAG: hypothetical protein QM765_35405 [Myxococcales bacterium]